MNSSSMLMIFLSIEEIKCNWTWICSKCTYGHEKLTLSDELNLLLAVLYFRPLTFGKHCSYYICLCSCILLHLMYSVTVEMQLLEWKTRKQSAMKVILLSSELLEPYCIDFNITIIRKQRRLTGILAHMNTVTNSSSLLTFSGYWLHVWHGYTRIQFYSMK